VTRPTARGEELKTHVVGDGAAQLVHPRSGLGDVLGGADDIRGVLQRPFTPGEKRRRVTAPMEKPDVRETFSEYKHERGSGGPERFVQAESSFITHCVQRGKLPSQHEGATRCTITEHMMDDMLVTSRERGRENEKES